MAGVPPENVHLVRRAQRDLDFIQGAVSRRIIDDIVRLARREFPGEIKKIHGLPGGPLQADSGRFRILHVWEGKTVIILTVFSRASQRNIFRSWRKNPSR